MEPFSALIRSDKPVLVDFHAEWCQPCKAMGPVIREVAQAVQDRGRVIKIDIDKNQETARQFNVQAVPTFIVFKNGRVVWRHAGMTDKATLMRTIEENS